MNTEQPATPRPTTGIPWGNPAAVRSMLLAGKVLSMSAQTMSEAVDSFSGWLLGGSGAVLALLFANLDKLKGFIDVPTLRHVTRLYVWAAALGVAAKFLAVIIAAGTKGQVGASELSESVKEQEIDLNVYLDTAQRAILWPGRWFLQWLIKKALQGDLTFPSRMYLQLAQVQTLLAFIAAVLLVMAAGKIAFSF